ncbi:MAG: hypothetical protein KBS60_01360 [Phascolarctobacterium sp.]|nr:hypothetical protein [Candidatus Phascolarctobacterium caballi]
MKTKKCCKGCDGYSGCTLVCEEYLGIAEQRNAEYEESTKQFKFGRAKESTGKGKVCPICGKLFYLTKGGRKYCSDICRHEANILRGRKWRKENGK